MRTSIAGLGLFALSFAFFCGCEPALHKDTQVIMGSYVEVTCADPAAAGMVFQEFKRIEALLNKYDKNSQVGTLNATGSVRAGKDLVFLLGWAKKFSRASSGALDITVAPLLDLWGFTSRDFSQPSAEQIASALQLVNMDKIIFSDGDNVVKFSSPGMKVDLGAIAVGYAVDRAAAKLKDAGIDSCLINAGGEIYALGTRAGKPWIVGIKDPYGPGVSGEIELRDAAVSTSGDYEQFFDEAGRRFSHIIDPRTGYPAQTGLHSVTVIAQDCLTADALATAVFVLGKEKGQELVRKFPGASMSIIER